MEALLATIISATDSSVLIAYAAIIVMAVVPIYIGAHRSLHQKVVETLSSKDAYMFPVIGSCVLFGLYLLFKYLSKEYVNLLLTTYFLFFGVFAVSSTLRPLFAAMLESDPKKRDKPSHDVKFSIPFRTAPVHLQWSGADIVAVMVGISICAWYVYTKHWVANNILGLSFSIQGVAFLSLGSYRIGCILLGGLFLYDIFWVFGTDVMVTVAKSFDAPIKLLWPKNLFVDPLQFSMLGLGDIVIPGIFVALMLRFDARRAKGRKDFKKPYFTFTFLGYFLGMLTTIAVMHFFQAAQPALLYLVPFCIGASLFAGALLGELPKLVRYSEEKKTKKQKQQQQKKKGKHFVKGGKGKKGGKQGKAQHPANPK